SSGFLSDTNTNPASALFPDLPAELPQLTGYSDNTPQNVFDAASSAAAYGTSSFFAPQSDTAVNKWYDNPAMFRGIMVLAPQFSRPVRSAGRFTVFSPRIERNVLRGIRYGLVNESSRLHLGTVLQWDLESPGQGSRSLMKLPGMTPPMADSILDWIDADKTPRPSGAEFEYYERIGVPYRPRNAIPATLEELLLVRDITRRLLFGTDESFSYGAKMSDMQLVQAEQKIQDDMLFQNIPADDLTTENTPSDNPQEQSNFFSGLIDENPADTSRLDSGETETALPWCFLLTTLSAEKLVDPNGNARIYVNEGDIEFLEKQLRQFLDTESADFIIQWRKDKGKVDDMLDLLDAQISVKEKDNTEKELKSPFSFDNAEGTDKFLKLLDYVSDSPTVVIQGRININEASDIVLSAIPGLDSAKVAKIIGQRSGAENQANRRHNVWILAEKIVDKETMKKLSKWTTTGGDVYRAQVIGFFDGQGTVSRAEAVIDSTVKPPRQIFSKDFSMFGSGFIQ
ncbi:MAG: general secretion pathway protein GspK, partial [Planctomycetaceae bacterium]|nr:general secretion pathway protein GspK [Planctomycetaceae bacterium]